METVNGLILEMNGLMDKKLKLFEEILGVTKDQKADIEANEAQGLGKLIAKKQAIIDNIDQLDRDFASRAEALKKVLNITSLDQADAAKYPFLKILKAKVEKGMPMASEIMELEKGNKDRLQGMFNELKGRIKQINLGKKSLKAYGPQSMNADGIYIDRKK